MKIEIDDSKLINDIVEKVVERLKPLLNGSHNPKNNALMDVKGLVDYLNKQARESLIKESWVYERVHQRSIPFEKAGKFLRFRKKYIDIWLINPYHPSLDIFNLNHSGRG
jgi:hypothetical protein